MPEDKISIIGAGYVGFPTALLLASKKNYVDLIDIDKNKIKNLKKGNLFIKEKNINNLFYSKDVKKYISFKIKPEKAKTFIICVPSDLNNQNKQNKNPVWKAIKSIEKILRKNDLIIIETTSEIGITEEIVNYLSKNRKDLFKKKKPLFYIAYCPERVFPGNTLYELKHNTRVIGGYNYLSSLKAKNIFEIFSKKNILTNHKCAEIVKLTENSHRNLNIGFSNELSILCEKLKINFNEVKNLANLHPRVNLLDAGIGVGGHCIPVDPYFLTSNFKELNLLSAGIFANKIKTNWIIRKIVKKIKNSKKKKILVWGITYKANVTDIRESPSLKIVKSLTKRNINLSVVDFNVANFKSKNNQKINFVNHPRTLIKRSLNIILVNHKKFNKFKNKIKKSDFIDLCNFFK